MNENDIPAFPCDVPVPQLSAAKVTRPHPGMTLRDYFAAMAMQGMLSNGYSAYATTYEINITANRAYAIAESMLGARSQP